MPRLILLRDVISKFWWSILIKLMKMNKKINFNFFMTWRHEWHPKLLWGLLSLLLMTGSLKVSFLLSVNILECRFWRATKELFWRISSKKCFECGYFIIPKLHETTCWFEFKSLFALWHLQQRVNDEQFFFSRYSKCLKLKIIFKFLFFSNLIEC